jgi:zinc and cadmium transporter
LSAFSSWYFAVGGALAVSTLAWVGSFLLLLHPRQFQRVQPVLLFFGAGALLGNSVLHLLPEAFGHAAHHTTTEIAGSVLLGFAAFGAFDFLHVRLHARRRGQPNLAAHGPLVLVGDGLHNVLDGLILAAAFAADIHLGWLTLFAIGLHEIPQELAEFNLLLDAGFSPRKALLLNWLSASSILVGVGLGYGFHQLSHDVSHWLLPIAAGNFLYISLVSVLYRQMRLHNKGPLPLRSWGWALGGFVTMGLSIWGQTLFVVHAH